MFAISTNTALAATYDYNGLYYTVYTADNFAVVTYRGNNSSEFNEYAGDVVIPSSITYQSKTYPVTEIDAAAFEGCDKLTSVSIPKSVTKIGMSAFHNCSSLSSVYFSNSITEICSRAFEECTNLTSVEIPNSVTKIGSNAFNGCTNLTSVEISNSLKNIDSRTFSGCSSLSSVVIPNSVTEIGANAFYRCSNLASVKFSNSVTTIDENAFAYCVKLKSVTLPNSVTTIESSAFEYCTGLTSIVIPGSVTKLGSRAFNGCPSFASVVFNAENCTSCGALNESAFPNTVTSITIGDNVKTIPSYFLYGLTNIESITIPNSVTSIGDKAFYGCTGLTTIEIPNSVTKIGNSICYNCDNIKKTAYPSTFYTPFSSDFVHYTIAYPKDAVIENGAIYSADKTILYYVPLNFSGSFNIPGTVKTISDRAFMGCNKLTSVVIPTSVTSILQYAFEDCSNLLSVVIPNSVTIIGQSAFEGCSRLTSLAIPESVTSIGSSAFDGCSALNNLTFNATSCNTCGTAKAPAFPATISSLTIGAAVTKIPAYFLQNGSKITQLIIPNSVTSIGQSAFANATELASVVIPPSVTSIGDNAFDGCTGLKKSAYPSSITNPFNSGISIQYDATDAAIDNGIIYNAAKSRLLFVPLGYEGVCSIPSSVTSIEENAFAGCTQLTSIIIPEAVTAISPDAFTGCTSLSSLTFNATNCANFSSSPFPSTISDLTLGNNVSVIPANFLKNGSIIQSLAIPESVTSIGASAFSGCTSLASLTFNAKNCSQVSSEALPTSISSLTIGDQVSRIPDYFLSNGCSIKELIIPESITSIGRNAFSKCPQLSSLTFNAINCSDFNNSPFPATISSVTLGDQVTHIPAYAFSDCSNLTSIEIPASIATIGKYAFSATGLAAVELPAKITSIPNSLFYQCKALTSINIPEAVTSIEPNAFAGCTSLTSLTFNATNCSSCASNAFPGTIQYLSIGNNVTTIPGSFLCNGSNIEYLEIPNSVKSIGTNAFTGSNALKSVVLGSGLLSIGSNAFGRYTTQNTTKAFWMGNTPPEGIQYVNATINYVSNTRYSFENQLQYQFLSSRFEVDGIFYIPVSPSERTCDLVDCNYSNDNRNVIVTNKITNRGIEFNVGNINDYAFYQNSNIETASIANAGDIGKSAFQDCSNIETASIANTGNIGNSAFYACTNICSLSLGDGVTAIGSSAFGICRSIPNVVIPNSVSSIGKSAFSYCRAIENVAIGTGISTLPNSIFTSCSSLKSIIIPSNVLSVEDKAFSGCTSLKQLTINDSPSLLTLGSNGAKPLFSDCPLDEAYIGSRLSYSTDSIHGYSPFYRNTTLRSVEISDTETQIYENEFYGCTNLQTLKIGNGVTTIGDYAFSGCSALNYFSAGFHVETIGNEAFSDCTGLQNYYSSSVVPPICGIQALDDINKWDCQLHVPASYSNEYAIADQWKDFFYIIEMDEIPVLEILVDITEASLLPNETLQLHARVLPSNATYQDLTWSSSDPDIATVSPEGLITALTPGSATITSTNGAISATITLTVKPVIKGDSNNNGELTITDAVNTANYAVGNEVKAFNFNAADVNNDGRITLTDASATVTEILNQPIATVRLAKAANKLADKLPIEADALIVSPTADGLLNVSLDNTRPYVALQADIIAEGALSIAAIEIAPHASKNHYLLSRRINDHVTRIALFNLNNAPFADNDDSLFTIAVNATDSPNGEIRIANIIAADASAHEYKLSSSGGNDLDATALEALTTAPIRIEGATNAVAIFNAAGKNVEIFAANGTKIANFTAESNATTHTLLPGIYIVKIQTIVEKIAVK